VIEREKVSTVEAWRARAPIPAEPSQGSAPLSLVDALPLPAAETDAQGRLLRANDAFRKLLARTDDELVGKPLAELLHPDDRHGALADVERLHSAGEGCVRSARYLKPDGSLLLVRSSLSSAAPGGDQQAHGLLLLLDADAKRSNDEERHRDDFLSVLSHELRSPIGAILMWVRLLQQGGFDASGSGRALTIVERSARSLERIVEDLLHVSRISAGKLSLAIQPLELGAAVEAAVEAAQGDAALKGVSLKLRRSPAPIQMRGDPVRLQQAVANLLSNAIKFTPSGGNVSVNLESSQGEVRIQVTDDGAGMSPDFVPLAFERFRQQDSGGSRSQHGLGLGLYIVRHLVELHGGCVKAESPGRGAGSTFTILLPIATQVPAPHREPLEPAPRPAHSIPKGLRVLVVDDDEDTREALKVILEQNGLQVFTAGSATDGLAKLEQLKPQLLLSDVAMPVVDGYGLIRKVRGLPREKGGEIPAAALTAYAGVDDRRSALAAGFQFHISKPIDQDRLLEVITAMARTLES
jgi:PAS domain S-box-containing protein